MALYSFDGTWNIEHSAGEYDRNTNVVQFMDLYSNNEHKEFYQGIGTRYGLMGKIIGGAFGVGGKQRIYEAHRDLYNNYSSGDCAIDVIGFSRGAALALYFVYSIAKKGVHNPANGKCIEPQPPIRFLGLWDVVAAFGIPIDICGIPCQRINLGYHFQLSPLVKHCFHAIALDERRQSFRVTRVRGSYEVWFRGVHSDIGGGNGNFGLSSIALYWMLNKAILIGLPIKSESLSYIKEQRNIAAAISANLDPVKQSFRKLSSNDLIHYSVSRRINCNNPCNSNLVESLNDEANRVMIENIIQGGD
jgi:uncharacterized protein (DUF2235 family)